MLSDPVIRSAKTREKPYKLSDVAGLYLLVNPNGSRWWRLKYRVEGREKGLSLGIYPDVSLKQAREKRDDARKLLAAGVDPSAKRQAEKTSREDTFEAIAREWLLQQEKKLAPTTFAKSQWMLEAFIFPRIGSSDPFGSRGGEYAHGLDRKAPLCPRSVVSHPSTPQFAPQGSCRPMSREGAASCNRTATPRSSGQSPGYVDPGMPKTPVDLSAASARPCHSNAASAEVWGGT